MSRVVVVTGASAGVGRAVAHAFAERGDTVALLARGAQGLDGAAREVRERGGRALTLVVDVADAAAVEAAAARVEAELGPIDVWVNNAMVGVFAPFLRISPEEYGRVTDVVYLGSVNGTRAALTRMVPRGHGHVVQVGSALAFRGIPLQSAYCGAKHALQGFLDSVRTELMHDRSAVRVTSVHLPAMNTTQFRLGRSRMPRKAQPVPPIYQPEVAARAVVWAAGHRRREVWVGESTVATILAARLVPGLLDHYLARFGQGSQLLPEPEDPSRPDYLWDAVPGDHGTHGDFGDRAFARSPQVVLSLHRGLVLSGAAGLAGAAGVALARASRGWHAAAGTARRPSRLARRGGRAGVRGVTSSR